MSINVSKTSNKIKMLCKVYVTIELYIYLGSMDSDYVITTT